MKTLLQKPLASFMLLFAIVALTLMSGAQAGTLPHNFMDDAGKVFALEGKYQVTKTAGSVQVVADNGTTYTYADASGALYVKLDNYMSASGKWYKLPGTFTHMNTVEGTQITCYGSSPVQTAFAYVGGSYTKFVPDGCAARAAIAAQSN